MYAVNLYLCDRAFGGNEEGGWYYECGEPVMHPLNRIFTSKDEAEQYHASVRKLEEELNDGRPSISSVLSQGRFRFFIGAKNEMPAPYPATRPYYE